MLIKITQYDDLDERKLMDVYSESNYENTDYFFPDEPDKEKAARQVEAGFLDFLKNDFFSKPEAVVWVCEENGTWLSALRTCKSGMCITLKRWKPVRINGKKGMGPCCCQRLWTP